MEVRYFKEPSRFLNRDMEFKVYGQGGQPCIAFPCECGRFYDFENNGMVQAVAPLLEEGRLLLITVDSIDRESWNVEGPARPRIEMQERWHNYICEEIIPRALELSAWNGRVLTAGCSLGALHAVNLYLRRPDLVRGAIGLSGIYSAAYFFDGYMDDLVYRNSPMDYMANMPADHSYIPLLRDQGKLILCAGQGAFENDALASTQELTHILRNLGVNVWKDIWGTDVVHDWPWWCKQLPYFLRNLLDTGN